MNVAQLYLGCIVVKDFHDDPIVIMFNYFYGNSFQHGHTLVDMMDQNLATNIYQVEQHRLDMHMESEKCYKTFIKLWIYPVTIILNNSIPYFHLEIFYCNRMIRKLPIIPRHV